MQVVHIGKLKRDSILANFGIVTDIEKFVTPLRPFPNNVKKSNNLEKEKCDYDDILMKAEDEEQKKKVHKVMKEFKIGKLKSSNGELVTERNQAIAIAMSEAGLSKKLKKSNGEGAKGGKVIGHTKSGKPIYESHDNAAHKTFTKEDHYDASEAHDNKYEAMEKKHPEGERTKEQQAQMSHHAAQATQHFKKYKSDKVEKAIQNIFA